jgi:hypothetical protein
MKPPFLPKEENMISDASIAIHEKENNLANNSIPVTFAPCFACLMGFPCRLRKDSPRASKSQTLTSKTGTKTSKPILISFEIEPFSSKTRNDFQQFFFSFHVS